ATFAVGPSTPAFESTRRNLHSRRSTRTGIPPNAKPFAIGGGSAVHDSPGATGDVVPNSASPPEKPRPRGPKRLSSQLRPARDGLASASTSVHPSGDVSTSAPSRQRSSRET